MTLAELHAAFTQQGEQISSLTSKLTEANQAAASAKSLAETAKADADAAKAETAKLRTEADALRKDVDSAKADAVAARKDAADAKGEIKASEDRITASLGALGIRPAAAKAKDAGEHADGADSKDNPWAKGYENRTEQARIMKADPEQAKTLKAAAGV